MTENEIIAKRIDVHEAYVKQTQEWLKTFETERLLKEIDNLEALLECEAIYQSLFIDDIDKYLEALKDECVARLKQIHNNTGAQ